MSDFAELKQLFIDVIEEEFSPKPVPLSNRWTGGTLVLKPNNDTQSKEIPLEVFFKKLTGIREALRVMEQKINNHEKLSSEEKSTLQSYITKAYGSLTSFNILFKEDKDKFRGSGSGGDEGGGSKEKMTYHDAKRKLGLNIY